MTCVTHAPVALLDETACLGGARCGLCVARCPEHAIAAGAPGPRIDPAACTACGECSPGCPSGALHPAGTPLAGVQAQLQALLTGGMTAILIACVAAGAVAPPGWALVEVPTLAIVTPGWILQLRARGVDVALAPCPQACCRSAHELDMVTARIAASPVRGEPAMREPIRLREPGATVDATLALSDPESTLVLASCASPVGVLAVDESACTICGACAASCPTGALALRESDGRIALHHDPALCIGCHRCQVTCPEHALDVRSEIDVPRLWRGSGELMHADPQRCTVCAAALTPPADAPPAQRAARRSGCPAVVVRRLRATRSTPCWPPA